MQAVYLKSVPCAAAFILKHHVAAGFSGSPTAHAKTLGGVRSTICDRVVHVPISGWEFVPWKRDGNSSGRACALYCNLRSMPARLDGTLAVQCAYRTCLYVEPAAGCRRSRRETGSMLVRVGVRSRIVVEVLRLVWGQCVSTLAAVVVRSSLGARQSSRHRSRVDPAAGSRGLPPSCRDATKIDRTRLATLTRRRRVARAC